MTGRPPLPVLIAVTGRWEAPLAAGLSAPGSGVEVVRRCADLNELLSAASAGLGRVAVVSADLPRLDRAAVAGLGMAQVPVVGLVQPGDDAGALRLTRLGISHVLSAEATASEVAAAVAGAFAALAPSAPPVPFAPPPPPTETPAGAGPRILAPLADPGAALADAPRSPPRPPPGGAPAGAGATDASGSGPLGKLIVVWGPVGAPGRTTIAVNLAAELAAGGHECLLVDADTYGASIAQTLGLLDESAGLASAARAANVGLLDVTKLADLAPEVSERLRVLTGLPQPKRWAELRASSLEVVWAQARRLASCTVVDIGFGLDADEELMFDSAAPRRHGAALSAIGHADLVIAVGAGDPIGLQRLLAGLPDLRELTGAVVPVQVVVTKVRDDAIGGAAAQRVRGALERYAGITDPVIVPDDRAALDLAMLAGRTLNEVAPMSAARRPLSRLAQQLRSAGGVLDDGREAGAIEPPRPGHRWRWRRSLAH